MPSSDREVFKYFEDNEDTAQEIDYLAYAAFAVAKFDWFDKFTITHNRTPTQDEVDTWTSELPDSRLDEIHLTAARVFRTAAREYMADRMEAAARKAVIDSIYTDVKAHNEYVVNYVKTATSFSRNLLPNIFFGIISSLIFALVIIVASVVFARDPSPLALYKSLAKPEAPKNP